MSTMSGSNEPRGDDERRGGSLLWKIFKFCALLLGAYWTFQWIASFLF